MVFRGLSNLFQLKLLNFWCWENKYEYDWSITIRVNFWSFNHSYGNEKKRNEMARHAMFFLQCFKWNLRSASKEAGTIFTKQIMQNLISPNNFQFLNWKVRLQFNITIFKHVSKSWCEAERDLLHALVCSPFCWKRLWLRKCAIITSVVLTSNKASYP